MVGGNAQMAEFAENMWTNYIKPKMKEELRNNITYYKAEVVSNPGDGTLVVRRPYDNEIHISCSDSLKTVAAGTQVIVLVFGEGNATNHIAISAHAMKDVTCIDGLSDVVRTDANGNVSITGRYQVSGDNYIRYEYVEWTGTKTGTSTLGHLETIRIDASSNIGDKGYVLISATLMGLSPLSAYVAVPSIQSTSGIVNMYLFNLKSSSTIPHGQVRLCYIKT